MDTEELIVNDTPKWQTVKELQKLRINFLIKSVEYLRSEIKLLRHLLCLVITS
jgi:hypothetical protein